MLDILLMLFDYGVVVLQSVRTFAICKILKISRIFFIPLDLYLPSDDRVL